MSPLEKYGTERTVDTVIECSLHVHGEAGLNPSNQKVSNQKSTQTPVTIAHGAEKNDPSDE